MDTLQTKFSEVSEAMAQGKEDVALRGLLWIHDNPEPADPSSEMFRRAYGFLAFAVLATKYAPAKEALINLIDTKKRQLAAGVSPVDVQRTRADLRSLEQAMQAMNV